MSYILDALRRAEAQREQGHVPGLHAQPLPTATTDTKPRRWPIAIAALTAWLALMGAFLLWNQQRPAMPGASPVTQSAPPSAPAAPTPVPPASASLPFVIGGAAAPAAVPAPVPVPAPAPPVVREPVKPPPPAAVAPSPKPTVAAVAAAPTPAAVTTAPPATEKPPAPAGPDATRIYTTAELPEDIRRDLPKLAVSGSVYSSNPAQRMLVLNGQVVQEGGSPGADVVLEQIRPKSAVLRFRGYRYSLDF